MVIGGAAAAMGGGLARLAAQVPAMEPATVPTRAGLLRGEIEHGVHVFRGIPYGEPTGGAARFKPPRPKAPWDGVRPATKFAPRSPQRGGLGGPDDPAYSEDCLALNVWTGSLEGGKPVRVWLHGCGWETGGSNDPVSNGAYLAAMQDVVLVSVNHRLGAYGFLNLAGVGGEEYAHSGHAGILDVVLALQWVRDNIAEFGGDPNRVMIFGQSGGGRKVSTLMAMPPAAGLFQRANVISGSALRMDDFAMGHDRTERLLRKLDIAKADFRQLLEIPTAVLTKTSMEVRDETGQFRPWVDGTILPQDPFVPGAPLVSAHVPLKIGTERDETSVFLGSMPEMANLSDGRLLEEAELYFPEGEGAPAVAAWRKLFPDLPNGELFARLTTARSYSLDADLQAQAKSRLGQAPAYRYINIWPTTVGAYHGMTPHGMDLPFIFGNLDAWSALREVTDEARHLRSVMTGAWAAFARDGDPHHDAMPQWLPYEESLRATMLFGDPVRIEADPFKVEREYMMRIGTEQSGPVEPRPPGPWFRQTTVQSAGD